MALLLDLTWSAAVLLVAVAGLFWAIGSSSNSEKYLRAAIILAVVVPAALALLARAAAAIEKKRWIDLGSGDVKIVGFAASVALLIGVHALLVRRAAHRRPDNLSQKKRVE